MNFRTTIHKPLSIIKTIGKQNQYRQFSNKHVYWSQTGVDRFVNRPLPKTEHKLNNNEKSLAELKGSVATTINKIKREKKQLGDVYLVNRMNDRRLGKGRHGVVRPALHRHTGDWVAVKSINKFNSNWYLDDEDLLREVRILDKLKGHPNVLQLKEVFDTPINLHIVTDLCQGKDLFTYLANRDFEPLFENQIRELMRQILESLHFCHDHGIIHLDIKLENIMLRREIDSMDAEMFKTNDFLLIDFGHCQCVDAEDIAPNGLHVGELERPVGSPSYASPEVLLKRTYCELSDAWSAGVILYVLMQGTLPFPHLQSKHITTFEMSDYTDFDPFDCPEEWFGFSDESIAVVKGLLSVDPEKRLSVASALAGKWINGKTINPEKSIDLSEDAIKAKRSRKSKRSNWYNKDSFLTPLHRSSASELSALMARGSFRGSRKAVA